MDKTLKDEPLDGSTKPKDTQDGEGVKPSVGEEILSQPDNSEKDRSDWRDKETLKQADAYLDAETDEDKESILQKYPAMRTRVLSEVQYREKSLNQDDELTELKREMQSLKAEKSKNAATEAFNAVVKRSGMEKKEFNEANPNYWANVQGFIGQGISSSNAVGLAALETERKQGDFSMPTGQEPRYEEKSDKQTATEDYYMDTLPSSFKKE